MKRGANIILILFCFQVFESKSQTISGIVNTYFKATYYASKYNGLKVPGVTGLAKGDRVLIIQMKGAVIDETNTSSFGTINALNGAGQYEFATICGFVNDTVGFENVLLHTYDFTKAVQVIHVPVYKDVTVSGTLLAQEWNAATETGGIIAIEATGTITLSAAIISNGAGYKGGVLLSFNNCSFFSSPTSFYYAPLSVISSNENGTYKGEGINNTITAKEGGKGKQANGGGGGNNHNTGGGGGSNYGLGGLGGTYFGTGSFPCNGTNEGVGGISLSTFGYTSLNNKIFFGGGGGAGHDNNGFGTPGGNGGGIIFIRCNELVGNNYSITANGSQGLNATNTVQNEANGDGGGGGGGGGVVLLDITTFTGNVSIEAAGANGSNAGFQNQCPGPGGGGGGGVIWHSGLLPGSVTTNVTGGSNGIIKNAPAHNPPCELQANGATSGTVGVVRSGFQTFAGSSFDCSVLSIVSLKNWRGKKVSAGIQLQWQLTQSASIEQVWIEKKTDGTDFKALKIYEQPSEVAYEFIDNSNELPATYRLLILSKTGRKEYSNQLFFKREKAKQLQVFPNPVTQELRIELPILFNGKTIIYVFDFTGKLVSTKEISFTRNQAFTTINVAHLPTGTYTVTCYVKEALYFAKIIKQ